MSETVSGESLMCTDNTGSRMFACQVNSINNNKPSVSVFTCQGTPQRKLYPPWVINAANEVCVFF